MHTRSNGNNVEIKKQKMLSNQKMCIEQRAVRTRSLQVLWEIMRQLNQEKLSIDYWQTTMSTGSVQ